MKNSITWVYIENVMHLCNCVKIMCSATLLLLLFNQRRGLPVGVLGGPGICRKYTNTKIPERFIMSKGQGSEHSSDISILIHRGIKTKVLY